MSERQPALRRANQRAATAEAEVGRLKEQTVQQADLYSDCSQMVKRMDTAEADCARLREENAKDMRETGEQLQKIHRLHEAAEDRAEAAEAECERLKVNIGIIEDGNVEDLKTEAAALREKLDKLLPFLRALHATTSCDYDLDGGDYQTLVEKFELAEWRLPKPGSVEAEEYGTEDKLLYIKDEFAALETK